MAHSMARKPSPVWDVFKKTEETSDGKNIKKAMCSLCDEKLAYCGGTSNLSKHIEAKHPETYEKLFGDADTRSGSKKQLSMKSFQQKRCSASRSVEITRHIAEMVSRDLRPVAVVDGPGFIKLLNVLEPGYVVPSRPHIMSILRQQYLSLIEKVRHSIEMKHVAITSDIWTSTATEAYITVTAHFIDEDWNLVSRVLSTKAMPERHTGLNIADRIRETLEEYKIPTNLVSGIVHDNASSMATAVAELEIGHVPCFAHTLQLAVNEGLTVDRISRLTAVGRKVVGHFKHSALAYSELKKKQDHLNVEKHQLVQDVSTRWNSTFFMYERLMEQRWAIHATFLDEKGTQNQYKYLVPSDAQWELMGQMVTVLKPLQIATTALCESEIVSCSLIYPVVNGLLEHHLPISDGDSPTLKQFKRIVTQSITRRFNPSGPSTAESISIYASSLDPRYHQLKFLSKDQRTLTHTKLEEQLQELVVVAHEETSTDPSMMLQSEDEEPPRPKRKKSALEYLLGHSDENETSNVITPIEEFENFRREAPSRSGENALSWWKARCHQYPALAKLARHYLCIPATSVPAERVFSTAGLIVSKLRASLKPETVDMLIFLNKNL